MVQWVKLCASNVDLIPAWGTRIPHAAWHSQKKKSQAEVSGR